MATAPRPVSDYYTDQDALMCDGGCGEEADRCLCDEDEPELCAECGEDITGGDSCVCDDLVVIERISPTAVML